MGLEKIGGNKICFRGSDEGRKENTTLLSTILKRKRNGWDIV